MRWVDESLRHMSAQHKLSSMTDAAECAKVFLAAWEKYLTALVSGALDGQEPAQRSQVAPPPSRAAREADCASPERGFPDRRLAPRPVGAHFASALTLWSSSRTVLRRLKDVPSMSSPAGERLRSLVSEVDALGPDNVAAALDLEIEGRTRSYLAGLEAYRRHPYRRAGHAPPVLWQEGTTRLLDYGGNGGGPGVLVVP